MNQSSISHSIANAHREEYIQKELANNKIKHKALKVSAAFLVFMFWYGRVYDGDKIDSLVYFLFSLGFVIFFFVYDNKLVLRDRDLRMLQYQIEIEELETRKELAELNGEVLPDYILEQTIEKPEGKAKLPITYYSILIILCILIFVLLY